MLFELCLTISYVICVFLFLIAPLFSTLFFYQGPNISEIGLHETPFEVELTLADKRNVKAKLYLAEVEAEGRRGPVFVAELDMPTPILGA